MTTNHKRQKRERKPLFLSASTRATATNTWRNPDDHGREFSRSLEPWIELAQLAEKGKFQSIFFVDHLSWFDVYGGNYKAAAKHGINASRIDPSIPISAIALSTKNIGIVCTFSTASEHPYHLARRLSSLDLLTNGRVSWNVVSSYLPSVGKNLLNGEPFPPHEERYDRAREYLDVVYKLLLSSWRDDAVKYDAKSNTFADPDLIREINHVGKRFNVVGPHITEPTPQRFPLITQAGSSPKGIDFGAENAELIFTLGFDKDSIKTVVSEVRKIAKERYGRDPNSIKFISPFLPFLGKTHEEAQKKFDDYERYGDPHDQLIYFGGSTGIDVSNYGLDDPIILQNKSNGVKSTTKDVLQEGKVKTPREIANSWKRSNRFVGTGEEVADEIEKLIEETGIDGLNFNFSTQNGGLKDIVELLIPELQKRGLAQKEYPVEGGTFRENVNGIKGETFLRNDHPAYNLRWTESQTREEFEAQLDEYFKLRDSRRAEYYN